MSEEELSEVSSLERMGRKSEEGKEVQNIYSTNLFGGEHFQMITARKEKDLFENILEPGGGGCLPIIAPEKKEEIADSGSQYKDHNKYIFQPEPLGDFDRVSNLLKHYSRSFVKNYPKYEHLYSDEEKKVNKKQLNRLKKKLEKKECITKKQIIQILRKQKRKDLSRKNRKVMQNILVQDLCENSKEENRLFHMITCRVFAIRCISEELIQRNVSH